MTQSTNLRFISMVNMHMEQSLFPLGHLVATRGAIDLFKKHMLSPFDFVFRHWKGDWGDIDDEDRDRNVQAMTNGTRILSAYRIDDNTKLWIITEADRSATTLLLPEEY